MTQREYSLEGRDSSNFFYVAPEADFEVRSTTFYRCYNPDEPMLGNYDTWFAPGVGSLYKTSLFSSYESAKTAADRMKQKEIWNLEDKLKRLKGE